MVSALSAKEPVVALTAAIRKGDLNTVEKLLESGIDPNTRIPGERLAHTPLFLSVQFPNPSVTKALLKAGADPSMEDENGDPVMVYAAEPRRLKHARLLIQHGVSIDSKNRAGITALLRGAPYENGANIQAIVDLGANLNLTDPDGHTAIMRATSAGNVEAMKVLIKAGAKLDSVNKKGETALMLALKAHRIYSFIPEPDLKELLILLIDAGADLNKCNALGQSALIQALASWDVSGEVIETLIAAKPNIHLRDQEGCDALYYAVLSKERNVHIASLMEMGGNPMTIDNEGTTLLMLAARNWQLNLVQDLIERGLVASEKNRTGRSAVHFASGRSVTESDGKIARTILKRLHKNGGSLTAADNDGNTPLHFAARSGAPLVVSYLLPFYADVEIQNSQGETPLHLAAANGNKDTMKLLFPRISKIDRKDSMGRTALMRAVDFDSRWCVQSLVKAGADIEAQDKDGLSSLARAFGANDVDQIKFLISIGADLKSLKNANAELLRVARLFHDEITSPEVSAFLVDHFAAVASDIDHVDEEGRTALMWVAASGNQTALKSLIDFGANLDLRSKDGRTALMWAACSQAVESMESLIAAGADQSLLDQSDRSASDWLAWAKKDHQTKTMVSSEESSISERIFRSREIALQNYLQKETWSKEDRLAGVPPLHLAAALGDTAAIKYLLQMGASQDAVLEDGSTPLMEAASNGHLKAVEALLKQEAVLAVEGADQRLRSALTQALTFGHVEVARLFLQWDPKLSDDETSLLTKLVHLDDELLLQDFLKAGARVGSSKKKEEDDLDPFSSVRRSDPASVFIAAARNADTKMLRVLIKFPKASGASNPKILVLALHHAAYCGRLKNVKILIEELKTEPDELLMDSFGGVAVVFSGDSDDGVQQPIRKFSALSRALEENFPEVVRYLVKQGASITGRTRDGAPPLLYVVEHKKDKMLRFFLEHKAPLELVDFYGQTALHHAAASNHVLAVRLLLQAGADHNAKTGDGSMPLDLARKNNAAEAVNLLLSVSKD